MPQNTTDVSTFTGSETDLGNGMKEYINNSCGFSCQYPSTWETIGKSDTEQILQLRGHGVSSLTVSYIKAPSKGKHKYLWKNIRKDFGKDGMRCSRRWKYPYKSEYCYPYE